MIALVLAPTKGNTAFPPLAIASLKGWLLKQGFISTTIDLNKSLRRKDEKFAISLEWIFGRPQNYLIKSQKEYYDIDTIYNFELLLKLLYPSKIDFMLENDFQTFSHQLLGYIEEDADTLLKKGFRYFGFSTYVSNIAYSLLLASKIKEKDPFSIIFFGGSSTSYSPIREFMIQSKIADYVIVGEGENAVVKLIYDLKHHNAKYKVIYSENIAPDKITEEEVIVPIIKNLDDLPFPDFSDFSLPDYFPKDKKLRILPIATSRGCIYSCSYCSETQYWNRYRQRSVSSVISEIKFGVSEYKAQAFFFCDSLINGNILWINEFCDRIIDEKITVKWSSYATIKNLDYALLSKMKESGCFSLTLGIEHVSRKVLKKMNKLSSFADADMILKYCVELGIIPIANIIYALPGEAMADFTNLLVFVSDPFLLNNVRFTFRPYEIRVGSTITNKLMENDRLFKKHSFSLLKFDEPLQSILARITVFWSPSFKYITQTQKKFQILNTFTEYQNNRYKISYSTLTKYNHDSLLDAVINNNSRPQFLGYKNQEVTKFQEKLIMLADGTRTLREIVKEMSDFIITSNLNVYNRDEVIEVCSKSTRMNLIELTQKELIIWS